MASRTLRKKILEVGIRELQVKLDTGVLAVSQTLKEILDRVYRENRIAYRQVGASRADLEMWLFGEDPVGKEKKRRSLLDFLFKGYQNGGHLTVAVSQTHWTENASLSEFGKFNNERIKRSVPQAGAPMVGLYTTTLDLDPIYTACMEKQYITAIGGIIRSTERMKKDGWTQPLLDRKYGTFLEKIDGTSPDRISSTLSGN